ncbi:MAG: hypothetical protein KDA54_13980 [Phycisphaerales bacterium]|nr:hypothetical protein [Phycisphaerales bacterium]
MGTWGIGLYSDDYALDIRTMVSAVLRLPMNGDELLDLLRKEELCADNPDDSDHFIFWLVVADQFARRGVECEEAKRRALEIIDKGLGLQDLEERGMSPGDLKARQKKLAELAEKIRNPPPAKPRKTIKSKQPFLAEKGSVWCYPTMEGETINPYFKSVEEEGFVQDGWGAMLVVDRGHAFEFLAWYAVVPVYLRSTVKPTLDDVVKARLYLVQWHSWDPSTKSKVSGGAGTLSRSHMNKMQFELLGKVNLNEAMIPEHLTEYANSHAASDCGITGALHVALERKNGPPVKRWLA